MVKIEDVQQMLLKRWEEISSKQRAFLAALFAGILLTLGMIHQVQGFWVGVPASRVSSLSHTEPSKTLSDLPMLHLFGKAESAGPSVSTLQLSLKGLYSGEVPEMGSAIISYAGQPEKVYEVGDRLPGGATLAGVYHDKITIDRKGQLEVILLKQPGLQEIH